MKKLIILLILALSFSISFANPPSKVDLSLNKEKTNLNIISTHHVSNPKKHFIYKVEIRVNDKLVETLNNKEQTNANEEINDYPISNLKKGDVIKVTSYCNMFGNKSVKMTVE